MRLERAQVIIRNGTSLSAVADGVIDLTEKDLLAIAMPAAWTAAKITFQSTTPDPNDGTYQEVVGSDGTEIQVTAAQGQYIVLTEPQSIALRGLAKVKVQSGVTGTLVNQGADRVLTLVVTAIT